MEGNRWSIAHAEMQNKVRWALTTTCSDTVGYSAPFRVFQEISGYIAGIVLEHVKVAAEKPDYDLASGMRSALLQERETKQEVLRTSLGNGREKPIAALTKRRD